MPRYIDADALYEKLYPLDLVDKRLYTINAKAVADAIAKTPTADVVPKSEVERLEAELAKAKEKAERMQRNLEGVLEERAEYPTEVVRKIFDELEYFSFDGEISINSGYYAELKKKYTEGGTEC